MTAPFIACSDNILIFLTRHKASDNLAHDHLKCDAARDDLNGQNQVTLRRRFRYGRIIRKQPSLADKGETGAGYGGEV
jgi:hypothetical protein